MSVVDIGDTDTITKGMSAGKGVGFIKWSDANAALKERTDIVDMALQGFKELEMRGEYISARKARL